MTNERDDIDKALEAYLEGKDGVSATYRKLEDEEPSADLDARILQAARDELALGPQQSPQAPRKSIYSRPYAIAASVLLGILIGVMIAPQPPMTTQGDETVALSDAPATFQAEADLAAPPEPLNEREQETLETAVAREAIQSEPAPAAEIAAEPEAESGRLGQIASTTANSEEITVTASPSPNLNYRSAPETWLEEIRLLQQEVDAAEEALEEELVLFREAYPDIDPGVE